MEHIRTTTSTRQDVYQRMIEDIADYAILLLDANGNVATWNRGAEQIKGYTSEEVIGQHFSIFYTQDDKAAGLPQALLDKAAAEGKAMTEGWRVKKGGDRFWGSVLITPIRDDDGVLTGFGKITRDLTDKKKNEDALLQFNSELERAVEERSTAFEQLQRQYQHMFRNNPLPMWVMDVDTFRFLEVNEVAETAYGYSREEFLNMSVVDIRPEADKEAFVNTLRPPVVDKQNFYRGIWQHRKKNGSIIEVEIFAHDIDFEGRRARLILSQDITYRRIAEKKLAGRVRYFRALLENNYDAILLYNELGVISYQSPASERMLGYTQEEIRHVNALDLFHAEDKQEVLKKLNEAVANPSRAVWVISRMKHKDGYNIWVEGTVTNLLEDDNVKAIVGNFRDVTERKLNAEQLMKSKREVEKVYREQIILSERMSSIFNALPANTALINNEGNIVSVNDAWRQSNDADDFIGASYGIDDNYLEILEDAGGDDERRIAKAIRSILAGQAWEYSTEYCLGKKGEERWLRAIISRENNNPDSGIVLMHIDITDRVNAEQKAVEHRKQIENLLKGMGDAFLTLDKNWQFTFANEHALTLMRKTKDEVLGQVMWQVFPDILDTRFEAELRNVARTQKDSEFEILYAAYDIWLDVRVYPHDGGIAVFYNNITERKKAEQKLESSYREIDRLLQHTQEAFIMLDETLVVRSCNNNARKFGVTYLKGEITPGMKVADLALPEGSEPYAAILAEVLMGERREVEMKFEKKGTGKIYFLNLMTPVLDDDGNVEGVFITIRNITEKKAAQEKIEFDRNNLSALINNTEDLIWSVDDQLRLLTSNTAFDSMVMKMSGHKARLGSKLRSGFGRDQLSRWDSWYGRALRGESFNAIEHTPTPFNAWVETSFYPIRNGEKIIGVACHSRDITLRIQSEKKIVNANRLYAFISAINQTIVHSSSTEEVFREACRIAVETGKFKMAWIGLIEKGKRLINLVEDKGMSAMERSLFLNLPIDDNGPADRVLKGNRYFYSNDVLKDRRIERWRPYARNTGVNSIMVLPIRKGGEVIGTFNLYATELNLFDTEEIRMLEEVASDISFSIEVFEKEAQRKETLEKLRLNEARLNEAQEIARVGNWEIDLKTGAQTWSQEAKRIIGYNPDSGLPVFESYLSSIHPDDRLSVMRMITESRTSHENVFFYCRVLKGEEVRYIYSESKYEFDEHNTPVRLHGILHDITNAKVAEDTLAQSEENLRLIVDLIPQAIYARDVNGKLLFVNKSFAKLFGKSPGQLISSSITDGGVKDLLADKDRLVIATGRTEVLPELECKDAEGNNRIFYTIKVPYTLAGSKEVAVLGIAMDVTERKLAELERNRIIADMVQRNKDLEQFSYIISHNLRAPVANISGIADIMQFDDMGEEEEAELMRELLSSVDKLDSVIKDLNYILQVKQEYSEVREQVNFSDLMTDIQQSIRNLITNEKVQVITDFSVVDGMMTLKSYLYSVMYNLLSNSIKYRRPGVPPVIRISSHRVEGKIVIEFEDNGLGIDLNKKGGQVFGLYKRFHSHTEGKGIGLYMVKTQVETLGGHIRIESEVNKGTRFIIEFDNN